jgi:hypothetical protein
MITIPLISQENLLKKIDFQLKLNWIMFIDSFSFDTLVYVKTVMTQSELKRERSRMLLTVCFFNPNNLVRQGSFEKIQSIADDAVLFGARHMSIVHDQNQF